MVAILTPLKDITYGFQGANDEGIGPNLIYLGHYIANKLKLKKQKQKSQISPFITSYECLLMYPCPSSPKFYKIFTNIVHVHLMGNSTIKSKIIGAGPQQPYSFDISID